MSVKRILSFLSVVALVAVLVPTAYADSLTSVKDTLTNSAPDTASNHTILFTTGSDFETSNLGRAIQLSFATDFDMTSAVTLAAGDFDISVGGSDRTIVTGSEPTGVQVELVLTDINNGKILFDLGPDLTMAAGTAVEIKIGTNATGGANQIINPPTTGAKNITIGTYDGNDATADLNDETIAVVHINDTVSVTATVQSSLTFVINGESQAFACPNAGGNADVTTTSTTIPYGNLTTGTPKIACQELIVTTNATNGYVVTVQQNQDLTSAAADYISTLASGGTGYDTPIAYGSAITWPVAGPPSDAGGPTNGYFGFTSDDTDYADFQVAKYIGFVADNTPYNVATESGPVSTETNYVSYEIEVNELQEAGTYTNTLMYICTATF